MRIVITGGAGFIGSHLVELMLKKKGSSILVVDNFSEGKLSNLPKSKRLRIVKASILDPGLNKKRLLKNADIVYHLAALTRPRWSIEYPVKTNRVNVDGTLNLLQLCVKEKIGKLVYFSSASVYGKQNKLLLSEAMNPHPMSPYALTKLIGENYCRLFGELFGLKYDIVRPFNVYGPRQSLYGGYSAAVPNFIYQLSNSDVPFITGDGRQVRDFIYVKDVAKLVSLIGERSGSGEVFNVGSGQATSINGLYKTICRQMGVDIKPRYSDPVIDPQTKANITKVKKQLNWKPEYNLKEGLKSTIAAQKMGRTI